MMRHKNKNTVFPHLTYELALSHLRNLEECVEAYRLPPVLRRQVPVAVCTMIEQFCRTKKKFMYGDGEPMPQKLTLNVTVGAGHAGLVGQLVLGQHEPT